MRTRWWLFISRHTLRTRLRHYAASYRETASLVKDRGDEHAEFYSGAAWAVDNLTKQLFYKSLSNRQVQKILRQQ